MNIEREHPVFPAAASPFYAVAALVYERGIFRLGNHPAMIDALVDAHGVHGLVSILVQQLVREIGQDEDRIRAWVDMEIESTTEGMVSDLMEDLTEHDGA